MKIVQINETCGTGSIGRTTAELAESLKEQGHASYVFFASGNAAYSDSIQIGHRNHQRIHAILSRLSGKQGYYSFYPTQKLILRLEKINPDIVHLRNLHANYINLYMLLKYLARKNIATVITLHDCWFYTGKCTYYISAFCQKWKTECNNCPLLHIDNINPTILFDRTKKCYLDKKKWFSAIPKLIVVGVSQWVTDEAKMSFFKDRECVTVYNWIDTSIFYPRNAEKLRLKLSISNKFVMLMVSTWISEVKGYSILKGLAECMDSDYQLIVIGKEGVNTPIPKNVIHIPHTNDANELAMYYSIADVCVNTTKFETFGKVTAEAMCCGTPVIVYNNTSAPEIVGEGCGFVIDETDGLQAVVDAILQIRKYSKSLFSNTCVSYAHSKFSKEKAIDQYLTLYKNLIEQPLF